MFLQIIVHQQEDGPTSVGTLGPMLRMLPVDGLTTAIWLENIYHEPMKKYKKVVYEENVF